MSDFSFKNNNSWREVVADLIFERERRGVSQMELSRRTGIKQSAISRLESMTVPPQIDTLVKIANALGLEIMVFDNNIKKEGMGMQTSGNYVKVKGELLFCNLTVKPSIDDKFRLVTDKEREFYFTEMGDTLLLGQRKRKLLQKFFNWIPIETELQIPTAFKGSLQIFDKDGHVHIQSLELDEVLLECKNGRVTADKNKARVVDVTTANGRVDLTNIEALQLSVLSSNGRINFENIAAKQLKASSNNGRVDGIKIKADGIDIVSNNGKILFQALDSDSTQLFSKNGKVVVEMCGTEGEYAQEIVVRNGYSLIAGKKYRGSYIFKDKNRKKSIIVNSKNGSVVFVFADSRAESRVEIESEFLDKTDEN